MRATTAAAVLLVGLGIAAVARADRPLDLSQAIALYESFEDEAAARALRAVLARGPSREVAARAHLYLGLIAVNELDVEGAIREFKLGLVNDPTLDVAPLTSPKARLTFEEARHELEGQLRQPVTGTPVTSVPAPTPMPTAAPALMPTPTAAPAPTPTPAVTASPTPDDRRHPVSHLVIAPSPQPAAPPPTAPTRWHSHGLALVFGGVGLLAGAFAIYGGVEVANFNSLVSTANGAPGTIGYPQTLGPQSAAEGWAPWVIPLAVLGVLGVAGGCFTW